MGGPGPRALQRQGVYLHPLTGKGDCPSILKGTVPFPVTRDSAMHCGRFLASPLTRRDMLLRCANGFGAVALAALLAEKAEADATPTRTPHFAARARQVI